MTKPLMNHLESWKKTEIITFYNGTKGGVDTAEQMCGTYSVQRNTQRWPMVIFYAMMNIGGINSIVIYLGNQLGSIARRIFLKNLAHELCLGEMQRRSQMTYGLHSYMQVRLKWFFPMDDRPKSPPPPKKRSRCCDCTAETSKRRLTNYSCDKCHRGICLGHVKSLCTACFSACQCEPGSRFADPDFKNTIVTICWFSFFFLLWSLYNFKKKIVYSIPYIPTNEIHTWKLLKMANHGRGSHFFPVAPVRDLAPKICLFQTAPHAGLRRSEMCCEDFLKF